MFYLAPPHLLRVKMEINEFYENWLVIEKVKFKHAGSKEKEQVSHLGRLPGEGTRVSGLDSFDSHDSEILTGKTKTKALASPTLVISVLLTPHISSLSLHDCISKPGGK